MAERLKTRAVFVCQECGQETLKWQGRCPECQAWNTLAERTVTVSKPTPAMGRERSNGPAVAPILLSAVESEAYPRLESGISEFDRVLGGGIVPGSLVLIGGDPGVGKSTLLGSVAGAIATGDRRVLYVSGEESGHQLKLRASRMGIRGDQVYLLTETNLPEALRHADEIQPDLVIIDSIQTVYSPELQNATGSVAQLRECTMRIMQWAKAGSVPVFIVGHVTKEGEIAGPRILEHIVDVVLYLEGERFSSYRLLRGVKNRFGAVSEVGVFEMVGSGLIPVDNPSEIFLAERQDGAIGSVIVPAVEGSRPMLLEIQALTSPTSMSMPRRIANGIEFSRLLMLTAVLTKRAGIRLSDQDVIVNVVGGLKVQEPAADLGVALAIASSHRDARMPGDMIALGEIGLSGELRSVGHLDRRLSEAERLGFTRCLLPRAALRRGRPQTTLDLVAVDTLHQALDAMCSG
ncbi:MAG: DNA repair protein RadA [Chloroflexi bacterium]|nr:DNA repair protein RadA [Chloroflexota bacterium]